MTPSSSKIQMLVRRNVKRSVSVADSSSQQHILIASLLIGQSVFSRSNMMKTAPLQRRISQGKKTCLHAEVALLQRFVGEDLHGPMLVTRYSRGRRRFALAKPCVYCDRFIRENFPRLRVFYSTGSGVIVPLSD